jgi:hypothetical protein
VSESGGIAVHARELSVFTSNRNLMHVDSRALVLPVNDSTACYHHCMTFSKTTDDFPHETKVVRSQWAVIAAQLLDMAITSQKQFDN